MSCNKVLGWLERLIRWWTLRAEKTFTQIERAEYTLPQRTLMRDEPHSVLSDSVFTRSSIAIQFTSHVLPPSSENDCSKRHESGLISETIKRTRMARPLSGS